MSHPSPLDFVPRTKHKRRYRFSLKTLFLVVAFAGPVALFAMRLPAHFYLIHAGLILFTALTGTLIWISSYAAPKHLVFGVGIAATCAVLLFTSVSRVDPTDVGLILIAATLSSFLCVMLGLASCLSWARYDK